MVKWYNLVTFDLIADLAFGESYNGLVSSEYHHWVATVFKYIKSGTFLRLEDAFPVLFKVMRLLLPKDIMEARQRQLQHAKITVEKRLRNDLAHARGDFMDSMLRHRGEKQGLTDYELWINSNVLIIAGSEITATLLAGVTYWLLRNPVSLKKATAEVRSTMKTEADMTFHSVSSQLPYMLACIDESFRMYPPVPGSLQRMTLTSSCISGYQIPARVSFSTVYRDDRELERLRVFADKGSCPPVCCLLLAFEFPRPRPIHP